MSSGGVQKVAITVKNGSSPNVIEVAHDKPVQLNFCRAEESSLNGLLMPDFTIRRDLPTFKTTLVELLPSKRVGSSLPAGCGCCAAASWLCKRLYRLHRLYLPAIR